MIDPVQRRNTLDWAWRKVDKLSAFACAEGGRVYDHEHYTQAWAQWLALIDRLYDPLPVLPSPNAPPHAGLFVAHH